MEIWERGNVPFSQIHSVCSRFSDIIRVREVMNMFLKFQSQDERKEYGSYFIELQFCLQQSSATLKEVLNNHEFWRDDSIYVYGDSPFYSEYKDVFGNGFHQNMSEGVFDYYGITYYKADQIDEIISRARQLTPEGYGILCDWLEKAKEYNGFYILGM